MKNILVTANDAGGAQILSSWIALHPSSQYLYCLEGPAINIFTNKITNLSLISKEKIFQPNFNNLIEKIYTATSWSSTLEKEIIKWGKQHKIHTKTFIDHWFNYKKRFIIDNRILLPDEIVTPDEYAFQKAKILFPQTAISYYPNPYLAELKKQISLPRPLDSNTPLRILYVTEPTRTAAKQTYQNENYFNYDEFIALENYLSYLQKKNYCIEYIRIRNHPAEKADKYIATIVPYCKNLPIEIGNESNSLIMDCSWADWVVGCSSMAMIIAIESGRKVFCAIPSTGKKLRLPHPKIINLFND